MLLKFLVGLPQFSQRLIQRPLKSICDDNGCCQRQNHDQYLIFPHPCLVPCHIGRHIPLPERDMMLFAFHGDILMPYVEIIRYGCQNPHDLVRKKELDPPAGKGQRKQNAGKDQRKLESLLQLHCLQLPLSQPLHHSA